MLGAANSCDTLAGFRRSCLWHIKCSLSMCNDLGTPLIQEHSNKWLKSLHFVILCCLCYRSTVYHAWYVSHDLANSFSLSS
jgi:hypothetical protein